MWKLLDEVHEQLAPGDYLVANCTVPENVGVATRRLPNGNLLGRGLIVHCDPLNTLAPPPDYVRAVEAEVRATLRRVFAEYLKDELPAPAPAPSRRLPEEGRWYLSVGTQRVASAGLRYRHRGGWWRYDRDTMVPAICYEFSPGMVPVPDECLPARIAAALKRFLQAEGCR